jgi:pimeloyl-ACP methyl ester carboxylesterase
MGNPILILHGWGSLMSGEKRFEVVKALLEKEGYTVFTPDLPGFGKNALVKEELVFEDYIAFVEEFIKEKKLEKTILLGHSFGGRIAIAFTAKHPKLVSKLILVSASGIPRKLSIKKMVAQKMAKIGKVVLSLPGLKVLYEPFRGILYRVIGEMDYYKARDLAKTFKNVYRVNVIEDLPKIHVPTLIVWGEDDAFTPLADGKLMHEKIKNSRLITVKDEGHKFPYASPQKFVRKVLPFIVHI